MSQKITQNLLNKKFNTILNNQSSISKLKFHQNHKISQSKIIKKHSLKLKSGIQDDEKVTTPHYGYHYDGINKKFFEGWYFKVMMPETKESFALIYSIQLNDNMPNYQGIGAQVMGPSDQYIIQFDIDERKFWADKYSLKLGACFQPKKGKLAPKRFISKTDFEERIELGFQSSENFHQGKIMQNEYGSKGSIEASVNECEWCFEVKRINGWGNKNDTQKATGGWLSAIPIFEPHWQVLMSYGLATGKFKWGNKEYEFKDAPTYYEKNWGLGFPSRWHWIQCNTFENESSLNVTAVGALRKLYGTESSEIEEVGMIGIHYKDKFYELVPWEGECSWSVSPWGTWQIQASNDEYKATIKVNCNSKGTILRAPILDEGLTPYCRDSFSGNIELSLIKKGRIGENAIKIVEGKSDTAVIEVGGGPWWDIWNGKADMKEPLKTIVKLPIDILTLSRLTPRLIRPPGV